MKTLIKLSIAIATIALGLAACAPMTHSSATLPATAVGLELDQPISSLADDEEGADEWNSDCRQELGKDSGDADRAHLAAAGEWINGCFVNGDDVDAFVIEVPAAQVTATYQIEFVHRGGAALEAVLVSGDGHAIAKEGLVLEGAHISRSLHLSPGHRYTLRIAKAQGQSSAWYRFKAAPVTQVAAK